MGCRLCPQLRTCGDCLGMSVSCQDRKSRALFNHHDIKRGRHLSGLNAYEKRRYCGTPSTAYPRNVAYLSPIFRCAIWAGSVRQVLICSMLSQTCTVTRFGGSPSKPVTL